MRRLLLRLPAVSHEPRVHLIDGLAAHFSQARPRVWAHIFDGLRQLSAAGTLEARAGFLALLLAGILVRVLSGLVSAAQYTAEDDQSSLPTASHRKGGLHFLQVTASVHLGKCQRASG